MRALICASGIVIIALSALPGLDAFAQTRMPSEAECQALRQQIAEHARLSEGVRRALAARPAAPPVAAPAAPAPAMDQATARTRLQQIPGERQQLEDQRLASMVRFDFSRASEIQGRIQALDAEKARLERELPNLPATAPPAAAPAPVRPASDADRVRCDEVTAFRDEALKIRRRELGAREDQSGALPLVALKGQRSDQIAQELASQFAPWPGAANQVGMLDADGDVKLDGFVDVPAAGVYRLYRQRSDGSIVVEVFITPGQGAPNELSQRLDEGIARQSGLKLVDLLALRPAGPARTLAESTDFARAHGQFQAGNFAEAGRLETAAARGVQFPNYRGETIRVLELFVPLSGGVAHRQVLVLPRPNSQELWEETSTQVRPISYWRTDVELTLQRQLRAADGASVGAPTTIGPVRFLIER
jgi:hypothetical protein